MKSLAIGFLVLATSPILQAQSFAAGINSFWLKPVLATTYGNTEGATARVSKSIGTDAYAEFSFSNGLLLTGTLGWQREGTWISDRSSAGVSGYTLEGKRINSAIFALDVGYLLRIAESHFCVFTNAGIGIGVKEKTSMDYEHSFDRVDTWYDMQGNQVHDTMHYDAAIVDYDQPQMDLQFRTSFGGEYRWKQIGVRVFVEMRQWLHNMAEIQYSFDNIYAEHEDHIIAPVHYHTHGHYFIKAGYIGVGIGVGWHFGSDQE